MDLVGHFQITIHSPVAKLHFQRLRLGIKAHAFQVGRFHRNPADWLSKYRHNEEQSRSEKAAARDFELGRLKGHPLGRIGASTDDVSPYYRAVKSDVKAAPLLRSNLFLFLLTVLFKALKLSGELLLELLIRFAVSLGPGFLELAF